MNPWSEHVLPFLVDHALDTPAVRTLRAEALAPARGRVLEIGFGTGLNLPHYPAPVDALVALEPSVGMRKRAEARLAAARGGRNPVAPLTFEPLAAERLPFPDAVFDTVVSTFTLCSILQVERALVEVHRVLRPGGTYLFLEHGRAPDAGVRAWQQRLEPLNRALFGGCHLCRDPAALVASAGLRVARSRQQYLPGAPRTHGWLTLGQATA